MSSTRDSVLWHLQEAGTEIRSAYDEIDKRQLDPQRDPLAFAAVMAMIQQHLCLAYHHCKAEDAGGLSDDDERLKATEIPNWDAGFELVDP